MMTVLLAVVMVLYLTACGGESKESGNPGQDSSADTQEDALQTDTPDEVQTSDTAEEASTPEQTAQSENTGSEAEVSDIQDDSDAEGAKILVVYFSATGTTKGVAEMAADYLQADLYEIIPKEPYTDEDLNWHDDNSRSTIEMNDSSSRPEIDGAVEDMEQYSVVFIGYPIWWGEAPRVVSTFVESYSFEGKTVVPFCTSSSSGLGSSGKNLEALTSGAQWLDGQRFGGGVSSEDVASWIDGLNIDSREQ